MAERISGIVVTLVLLAAACGDSGTPSQDLDGDRVLAEQAVLTAKDLGTGWIGQPRDPEDPEGNAPFRRARYCRTGV